MANKKRQYPVLKCLSPCGTQYEILAGRQILRFLEVNVKATYEAIATCLILAKRKREAKLSDADYGLIQKWFGERHGYFKAKLSGMTADEKIMWTNEMFIAGLIYLEDLKSNMVLKQLRIFEEVEDKETGERKQVLVEQIEATELPYMDELLELLKGDRDTNMFILENTENGLFDTEFGQYVSAYMMVDSVARLANRNGAQGIQKALDTVIAVALGQGGDFCTIPSYRKVVIYDDVEGTVKYREKSLSAAIGEYWAPPARRPNLVEEFNMTDERKDVRYFTQDIFGAVVLELETMAQNSIAMGLCDFGGEAFTSFNAKGKYCGTKHRLDHNWLKKNPDDTIIRAFKKREHLLDVAYEKATDKSEVSKLREQMGLTEAFKNKVRADILKKCGRQGVDEHLKEFVISRICDIGYQAEKYISEEIDILLKKGE